MGLIGSLLMPDESGKKIDLNGVISIQKLPVRPSQAESLNVERDCTNQNTNASENFEESKIIDKEKDCA